MNREEKKGYREGGVVGEERGKGAGKEVEKERNLIQHGIIILL